MIVSHSDKQGQSCDNFKKHPPARSPVQLEGIWAISMCRFLCQVLRQVDNHDSIERTFLRGKRIQVELLENISPHWWPVFSSTRRRLKKLLIAWHTACRTQHTFTQIPHPMQSSSEIHDTFDVGETSIQSFPGHQTTSLLDKLLWPELITCMNII